jgi:hypothetical protein
MSTNLIELLAVLEVAALTALILGIILAPRMPTGRRERAPDV